MQIETDSPRNREIAPLAYRVGPFCNAIGISRTTFYELLKRNEIQTVVIGGRRLVPASEAQRLLSEGGAHDGK